MFNVLRKKGFIYKGVYKGFYCKSDESYFTEKQLKDKKCPVCSREVTDFSEDSYFLKVSLFSDWISNVLKTDDVLFPDFRVNELLNSFLK